MAGELDEDDMMGEVASKKPAQKTPETPKPAETQKLIDLPDRDELEEKLTEAEEKVLRSEEKALRAVAEMHNIQRRSEQRIAEAHRYGVRKLLEELIPILDSLEQSLAFTNSEHELVNSMREGMAMTFQMLLKVLEKFGVKEINPVNEVFNPAFHEVMMAQEKSDVPPNTIISVMQKGYQLHDRLIRPARVIIAK